jgi:hypothetical protein
MNELQQFAARVQAALAFVPIIALIGLAFVLILVRVNLASETHTLLTTVVTAIITSSGTAYGFWLARHRPPSADGSSEPTSPPVPTEPAIPAQPSQGEAR